MLNIGVIPPAAVLHTEFWVQCWTHFIGKPTTWSPNTSRGATYSSPDVYSKAGEMIRHITTPSAEDISKSSTRIKIANVEIFRKNQAIVARAGYLKEPVRQIEIALQRKRIVRSF